MHYYFLILILFLSSGCIIHEAPDRVTIWYDKYGNLHTFETRRITKVHSIFKKEPCEPIVTRKVPNLDF